MLTDAPVIWNQCASVLDDEEVRAWLKSRCLDAGDVDLHDVARALPTTVLLPRWAQMNKVNWWKSGHRLLLRTFNAQGAHASMRGRYVRAAVEGAPKVTKSLTPGGTTTTGLVMANSLGQRLLAGDAEAVEVVQRSGAVMAEGDVDFLTWATRFSDADDSAPAVFGYLNTSWTDELAARIPDGTRVRIRAHDDEPGREYARTIGRTLFPRCIVSILEPRA